MNAEIEAVHHIELWVADAKSTAASWISKYGFGIVATATAGQHPFGCDSIVLRNGTMHVIVTSPPEPSVREAWDFGQPGGAVGEPRDFGNTGEPRDFGQHSGSERVRAHVRRHGDGVRALSFAVGAGTDLDVVAERIPGTSVTKCSDEHGEIRELVVPIYGDTVHTLRDDSDYRGVWAPGYVAVDSAEAHAFDGQSSIAGLDHANAVLDVGETGRWVDFYERALGFVQTQGFDPNDLTSEDSAVMNRVIGDGTDRVKLPITEPSPYRPGHVGIFLDANSGPGIQHLALRTDDIVATVTEMAARGVEFMKTKPGYYRDHADRIAALGLDVEEVARLGILIDSDEEGSLLQVFTHPVVDRPTLFLELIERRGSRGFGAANIKWLASSAENTIKKAS